MAVEKVVKKKHSIFMLSKTEVWCRHYGSRGIFLNRDKMGVINILICIDLLYEETTQ